MLRLRSNFIDPTPGNFLKDLSGSVDIYLLLLTTLCVSDELVMKGPSL